MTSTDFTPGAATPTALDRDGGTQLIAGYHFLLAGLYLLATIIMVVPTLVLGVVGITEDGGALIGMFFTGLIAFIAMAFTIGHIIVGYGLWTYRQWGRVAAIALAVIGILAFPIGTIAGALILWHLLKPEVSARFS